MSVVEVRLAQQGMQGQYTGEGPLSVKGSYTVPYKVKCNNVLDSPTTIREHFRLTPGLPFIGDFFRAGNGFDGGSFCKNISPKYIENSGGWWDVDVQFEPRQPEDEQQGQDADGNTTADPMLWREEIDVSYTQTSAPVEKAIYRGGMKSRSHSLRKLGTAGAVVNSALVPFDPPLEKEVNIRVIRFQKNVPSYNGESFDHLIGAVNMQPVTINKRPYRLAEKWGATKARIKNVGAKFNLTNRIPYWTRTLEVWVNPLGWRAEVLDRGTSRRAMDGDLNDQGQVISPSDIVDKQPFHRAIKDANGYPISEPILLDGNGSPLRPGQEPVYITYEIYPEIFFTTTLF